MSSLFLKFFCYVTWFDETRHWRSSKRGLNVKPYCFFETKKQWLSNLKNTNCTGQPLENIGKSRKEY